MLTEFELIKHCFNWPQNNSNIKCAVGDDASIVQVPNGHELVQSIDTQVADVHFPASAPAHLIAQRALRCAISDLAAMGATPQAFHLALSLPKHTSQPWLESFSSGLRACAQEYAIDLIGGDTTSSPFIVITLQVQGIVAKGKALRRNSALIGDDIWLSGEVGRSAAALSNILESPNKPVANDHSLAAAYFYPDIQIALGKQLQGLATSALDISDGLLQDMGHIARASQCCLNIERSLVPVSALAIKQCGQKSALQFALSGGDDYQLLFTANPSVRTELEALHCFRIGAVQKPVTDQWVLLDSQPVDSKHLGYQHF